MERRHKNYEVENKIKKEIEKEKVARSRIVDHLGLVLFLVVVFVSRFLSIDYYSYRLVRIQYMNLSQKKSIST